MAEKSDSIRKPEDQPQKKGYGHQKMRVWQNCDRLDTLVQKLLRKIPRNEYKLRSQIDSASDSVGANYVEGYYSGSLGEYIRFCRYGKRSLGELQERIRRTLRKSFISKEEFEEFDQLAARTMFLFDRLLYSLEDKKKKEGDKRKLRG